MKVCYVSDLHFEFSENQKLDIPKCDVLIVAGDLCTNPAHAKNILKRMRSVSDAHVLYVLGNHEFYGHDFIEAQKQYRQQFEDTEGITLLEKDIIIIDGVLFLGTTLWSDLSSPLSAVAAYALNDFRIITNCEQNFTPLDATSEWISSAGWLRKTLTEPFEGRTVVITHHSPSTVTTSNKHMSSPLNPCFHSDMNDLINEIGPEFWVYGHDHVTATHKVGNTELRSFQPGYPSERSVLRKKVTIPFFEI